MRRTKSIRFIGSVALAGALIGGCVSAPQSSSPASTSPAVVASATSGVPSPSHDQQAVSTLACAAAGPAGGWIVATTVGKLTGNPTSAAAKANQLAEEQPACSADVRKSDTADLNHDGFVTLDEILAMKRAKLDDAAIIARMRATNAVFALSARQLQYLRDRGIDQTILDAMVQMNGKSGLAAH